MTFKNLLFSFIFLSTSSTLVIAQSGMALSLDGVDDYMEVADHPDLDIDVGESFTITLWVKISANDDFYRILSKRAPSGGANPGYEMITQEGGGAYGMNLRSTSNVNSGPPFGTTRITDGTWHHLAMVINAAHSTATIYVDGISEKQSNVSAIGTQSFANNVPLLFGTEIGYWIFTKALLDDIRFWQKPLSEQEIQLDMSALVDGSETFLIAGWDFEDVTNEIVQDLKNQHDGMLFGGATILPGNAPMVYKESNLATTTTPVGQGDTDQRIVGIIVKTEGSINPLELTQIQFNISDYMDISDIDQLKIFYTGGNPRLNTDSLFGMTDVQEEGLSISGHQTLKEGLNYFWVTADLNSDAKEGNFLRGNIISITIADNDYQVETVSGEGRLIILEHKLLFSGGDYGSVNYRIPAIETAADNSLIIAADARVDRAGDLPNNVDIVIRRSTDKGHTWSSPITIADFGQFGASDPALVLDRKTGDLLCMFASHSGLFQSTSSNPIRFQVCRSGDNGKTWSSPQDFSSQIYNPSWSAAWLASGSAHQLRNGRIVGAVGVRETSGNAISNFMIFSDDGGYSWNYKPNIASVKGNEAKIVELDNGNLMMNIRNQSPDRRQIVISEDGGESWGIPYYQEELIDPFVNGDLIRYTSVLDGYDKSRLLFSIAAHTSSRRNLTVFLSYDEGTSWPISKTIHLGASGYSSLTVLEDGTIGCFYENGEHEAYQLYFARFSLDWLTDMNDTFLTVSTEKEKSDEPHFEAYPIPSTGIVTMSFELGKRKLVHAALFDRYGIVIKELISETLPAGKYDLQFDLNSLPSGVYFVKAEVDRIFIPKKIVITK